MKKIIDLPLKDAKVIYLDRHTDRRGWFSETFRQSWLTEAGINNKFIFEFWSFSEHTSTLRGLHAQTATQPQAKLVTVLHGGIYDVLVDARLDSPTYGKSYGITIGKDNPCVVYIPRGFYHGFITLDPNTYVGYKVDNYHNAAEECGVDYKTIEDIKWPIKQDITISDRDSGHPSWNDCYKFQGTL